MRRIDWRMAVVIAGLLGLGVVMVRVRAPAAEPGAQAGTGGQLGAGAQLGVEPNLRVTNEVRVYQMTKDAVVNISSTRIVTARVGTGDEVFDRFFGGQIRQVPAQSLGSGFVIHSSGYIVTNEHVIDQATDVQVMLQSGEKLEAVVLATDNEHDLAVLKVNPKKPLPAIALGESEDLMIGEPVCAIGNPFGYAGTMTHGIISALNRDLEAGQDKSYKGLIQTDASINPGNSGGPLINAYGQVVGVNTAIRAGAQGIGFAIGVSNVRDLLPGFLNPAVLNQAQVGFTVEEKRVDNAPATVGARVLVKNVSADSGASKAGLLAGDQIVSVGGAAVGNVVDALVAMASVKAGDELPVTVMRGSGAAAKRVEMKMAVTKVPVVPAQPLLLTKMGVEGETVTPELAKEKGLAVNRGIWVKTVTAGSPAAKAKIQAGDVLYQLGPYYVGSVEDAETLLKTVKQEMDVPIGIVRGDARGRGMVRIK